jgi:DNA polymerase sigma
MAYLFLSIKRPRPFILGRICKLYLLQGLDDSGTAAARTRRHLIRHQSTSATGAEIQENNDEGDSKELDANPNDRAFSTGPVKVHHNYDDIDINSLEATLAAHKRRNLQWQPRIRFVRPEARNDTSSNDAPVETRSQRPLRAGDNGAVREWTRRAAPWEGRPIFSSFEDFRAKHQASDEELIQLLGLTGERNEESGLSASDRVDEPADEPASRPRKGNSKHRDFTQGRRGRILSKFTEQPQLPGPLSNMDGDINLARTSSEEFVSAAIREFEDYYRLSESEHKAVQTIIKRISRVFTETLPDTRLEVHGSHATGLESPRSNIDFNIPPPDLYSTALSRRSMDQQAKEKSKPLHALRKAFTQGLGYCDIRILARRCPVLVMRDQASGLFLQISSGMLTNTTTQTVLTILDEHPSIRPLFILIRHCLNLRGLTHATMGGISSYPLLVMVLTALRHSKVSTSHDSLAKQLLAVLDFWIDADIHTLGYSAEPPMTFPKFGLSSEADEPDFEDEASTDSAQASSLNVTFEFDTDLTSSSASILSNIAFLQSRNDFIRRSAKGRRHLQRHPWQLSLQDPADPVNDLGAQVYRIADVIATFQDRRNVLVDQMAVWDAATPHERMKGQINPMRALIAADYRPILKWRSLLQNAEKPYSEQFGSQQ